MSWRAFMSEFLDLPLDERPPPKERLDPLDNKPRELGRSVHSGIGEPRQPLRRVVRPDIKTTPPCETAEPEPFAGRLALALPTWYCPIRKSSTRRVRPECPPRRNARRPRPRP